MCIRDRLCTTRAGVEDTAQPDRQPRRTYAVADPSFDVVSKVDRQEVDNALNQAAKEIATRYDFKGVGASIAWSGTEKICLLYTSDAADDLLCVDLGGRRIIKK